MKITRAQLKQIIKEELEEISGKTFPTLNPVTKFPDSEKSQISKGDESTFEDYTSFKLQSKRFTPGNLSNPELFNEFSQKVKSTGFQLEEYTEGSMGRAPKISSIYGITTRTKSATEALEKLQELKQLLSSAGLKISVDIVGSKKDSQGYYGNKITEKALQDYADRESGIAGIENVEAASSEIGELKESFQRYLKNKSVKS